MSQESEWRYKILNRIDFQNLSFSRWKSLIWWKEYLVTCAVYDQLGICYTLYLYLNCFEMSTQIFQCFTFFTPPNTLRVWPSCLFPVQQQRSSKLVTHIVRNCGTRMGKLDNKYATLGTRIKLCFWEGFLWQKISDQSKIDKRYHQVT